MLNATAKRSGSTAIYYLLTDETFSALHQLPGDEIFHFYLGDPVEMLQLRPDGSGRIVRIGTALANQMAPQVIVPGGTWQGSRLIPGGSFALLGTTMSPGFDFADYVAGNRHDLSKQFPQFADSIASLTVE
jgi:predicted cupin superfamily sugar epimerase